MTREDKNWNISGKHKLLKQLKLIVCHITLWIHHSQVILLLRKLKLKTKSKKELSIGDMSDLVVSKNLAPYFG